MEVSVINLLQPRYKVIAGWPGMDCNVGDVIELPSDKWQYIDYSPCLSDYFDTWPNLFRPMPWHEDRSEADLAWWEDVPVEEMPDYLKDKQGVWKVAEYCVNPRDTAKLIAFKYIWEGEPSKYASWLSGYIPATEQEYLDFMEAHK